LREYIIPVVFDVTTDTDASEMDAARMLAVILGQAKLAGLPRYGREGTQGRIESWHLQNHPLADGSDHEAAIVFLPVHVERREGESGSAAAQRAIDGFLATMREWLRQ
jgi:hypothetical protein